MSTPKVTVCVVTYNQCNYIRKCLCSILDQETDAEVRILVGDDGSTDGTSQIIESLASRYGARLRHFRRDPNMGANENMCDLLARAGGKFIARVDGDDYWLPGKLAQQLKYLSDHPHCSAVYTNAITIDQDGNRLGLFNDLGDARLNLPTLLSRGNVFNNSSVLFRSDHLPLWSSRPDQLDYQVHLALAQKGWIGHIGQPLTAYRVSSLGSMVATCNEKVRELYWQAIQSVPRDAVSDTDYARGLADFLRRVFFRAISTRDPALLRIWAARIYVASPYGRLRTNSLAAWNIARMAAKIVTAKLPFSRQHRHVLYRH